MMVSSIRYAKVYYSSSKCELVCAENFLNLCVTLSRSLVIGSFLPACNVLPLFRPPKFLPRSDLKSIACGRGSGGQSSSRYVDMVLQRHQDDTVEFTNIQREELAVLNQYIHQVLIPAMQEDAKDGTSNVKSVKDGKDKADDETDDDDEEEHQQDDDEISDEDDENFVDGNMDTDEGDDDEGDDDGSGDDDEADDDFEVVDDDFAKELAKRSVSVRHDEPRASRSRKRKEMHSQAANQDDDDSGVNDADFEVVHAESSTESEGDHSD